MKEPDATWNQNCCWVATNNYLHCTRSTQAWKNERYMSSLFAAFFISLIVNSALLRFAMLSIQLLLEYILRYENFYQADHNAKCIFHRYKARSMLLIHHCPMQLCHTFMGTFNSRDYFGCWVREGIASRGQQSWIRRIVTLSSLWIRIKIQFFWETAL